MLTRKSSYRNTWLLLNVVFPLKCTWSGGSHVIYYLFSLGKYKKAVLVNVFQWFNKGDHLITIGQRRILERMGIKLVYHCFYPGRDCNFKGINKQDPELVSGSHGNTSCNSVSICLSFLSIPSQMSGNSI